MFSAVVPPTSTLVSVPSNAAGIRSVRSRSSPPAGLDVIGVADQRDADQRHLAVVGDLLLRGTEVRVVGDGGFEHRDRRGHVAGGDVAGDDHLGGVGR